MTYHFLEDLILATAEAVRPPERMLVSEAATEYRQVINPGVYSGKWDNDFVPYLIDPMDTLGSRNYTGMIFVGPAQCGKTEMVNNFLLYSCICDPADLTVIHIGEAEARDFYFRRINRFYEQNPEVAQRILPGKHSRGITMTKFLSGMLFTLGWPSINQLSGKPIPRLWLTDYDRMPESIDGEGAPFDLARKRATTFRHRGMTVAESSPGWEIDDPRWSARTPHEAPPTKGILALYNRGDRRRWYWRCPHCNDAFEPDFSLLRYNAKTEDLLEAAELAYMECPRCSCEIFHTQTDPRNIDGHPGKHELNLGGRWVRDNMIWRPGADNADGLIEPLPHQKPLRAEIASYWLKGPAAEFVTWKDLVYRYLQALKEFVETASQEALKTTVNTDQGLPYLPRGSEVDRLPEDIKSKAVKVPRGVVPEGVRYIIVSIDIQKNRFVIQVHGFGRGGDIWIIDRYEVKFSRRPDPQAPDQLLWVNPGSYVEDWYILISDVLTKDYPLADGSGRMMRAKLIGCDSGGREGVTKNAYNFYRFLVHGPDEDAEPPPGWTTGLAKRFQLLKGTTLLAAPRQRMVYPDSERKDRRAAARGEVPVLMLNSNQIKDQLNNMLNRDDPTGGKINFPDGLPDSFYTELTVETRTPKGWENPKNLRNESWDLLYYAIGLSLSRTIKAESISWDDVPTWAEEWDSNSLVYKPTETTVKPFEEIADDDYDLAEIAAALT